MKTIPGLFVALGVGGAFYVFTRPNPEEERKNEALRKAFGMSGNDEIISPDFNVKRRGEPKADIVAPISLYDIGCDDVVGATRRDNHYLPKTKARIAARRRVKETSLAPLAIGAGILVGGFFLSRSHK